jgi:hypothetical protein
LGYDNLQISGDWPGYAMRKMGYPIPALVTYANGFLLYLPEPDAFPEGGYEVQWAESLGLSKQFQPHAWAAV